MFFKRLRMDIAAAKNNDPAARNKFEIFLTYSGVRALSMHRFANRLYRMHLKLLARMVSQYCKRRTGIEIHPAAKIASGVFIDHGEGVVIGETAEVGTGTVIYQGCTLGGTGKETGKRHPTLCDNVMVSAGAKILGSFTIGENSKIGAGSVVLEEVPANCTVVGVPGRIVKRGNEKVPRSDMDQVNLPDPVKEDIAALQHENTALCNKIFDLQQQMKELQNLRKDQ